MSRLSRRVRRRLWWNRLRRWWYRRKLGVTLPPPLEVIVGEGGSVAMFLKDPCCRQYDDMIDAASMAVILNKGKGEE